MLYDMTVPISVGQTPVCGYFGILLKNLKTAREGRRQSEDIRKQIMRQEIEVQ